MDTYLFSSPDSWAQHAHGKLLWWPCVDQQQFLWTASPKPHGQLQANFTEMILRWYSVKVVQKFHYIEYLVAMATNRKTLKILLVRNHKAQSLDIGCVAYSSEPQIRFLKLYPRDNIDPPVICFYIDLHDKISFQKP